MIQYYIYYKYYHIYYYYLNLLFYKRLDQNKYFIQFNILSNLVYKLSFVMTRINNLAKLLILTKLTS